MAAFKKVLIGISVVIGTLVILVLAAVLYLYINNHTVACSSYDVYSKKLPYDFDGYRIGVVSDFHNGDNYDKVLKQMRKQEPDIVTIVGDSINSDETAFDNTKLLLSGLVEIAPTYLVSGNHERWADKEVYQQLLDYAKSVGVVCMDDQVIPLTVREATINLVGAQDEIYSDDKIENYHDVVVKHLDKLYNKIEDHERFSVLLFHRGNLVEMPAQYGYDLILSGHLHGGIVNLPWIRDRILQEHGDDVKYYKGQYRVENSQVIVSGGLEARKDEVRVLNPPEVVIVNLYRQL